MISAASVNHSSGSKQTPWKQKATTFLNIFNYIQHKNYGKILNWIVNDTVAAEGISKTSIQQKE
jgi:hypothetical protein